MASQLQIPLGGDGVRSDTQEIAQRIQSWLLIDLLATQGATELVRVERLVAVAGGSPMPCHQRGFAALDRRAHYCPKC